MPFGMNAPKLCPAEPLKLKSNRILGQAFRAIAPRDFAAEDGADHAVHVANRQVAR